MSLRRNLLVIICGVIIASGAVSGTEVKKAVGDEVSFGPDKPLPAPVSSITWKHIKDGETVKAIEWEDGETLTSNPRFNGITTLDTTGQITIKKLKIEHSGVYTIDISGKEQAQRFTLTVMERVSKPVIKIEPSDNPGVVYLICEYSDKIIWKNSAGETLTGSARQPKGEFITVRNKGNPEIFYTCTLQNTASEETSERVYERDLFQGFEKPILTNKFVIWISVVLICLVFILLFLFIPTLHGSCAARCGGQKTSRK